MLAKARRFGLALLAAAGALIAPLAAAPSAVAAPEDDERYAAIVVDANSGEVLYSMRADAPRYPASITKIMTLYLTFEAISTGKLKPTDLVPISRHAAEQAPSKLGLAPGESLTVDDAIRAVAIKSANDIAVALAEKIGGSEPRFAALMTLRAHELGMTTSNFVNANGLPDTRQLVSARDIAILSRAVMRDYPQYYAYFSQRTWTFRGMELRNHNGLLFSMPGVDGIKTGFTNASGFNLAASATRDGRRLITVMLGGASTAARNGQVETLLNVGFDVERRRAKGEVITVAQLLNQNRQAAPMTYASLYGSPSSGSAAPYFGASRGFAATPASASDAAAGAPRPYAPSNSRQDGAVAYAALAPRPVAMAPIPNPPAPVRPVPAPKPAAAAAAPNLDAAFQLAALQEPAPVAGSVADFTSGLNARALRTGSAADGGGMRPIDNPPERPRVITASADAVKPAVQDRADGLRGSDGAGLVKVSAGRDHKGKPVKADARRPKDAVYLVQVGSFKQKSDANEWLRTVGKRFDDQFSDADSAVAHESGWYRARYQGLTQSDAKAACQALKAKRVPCQMSKAS